MTTRRKCRCARYFRRAIASVRAPVLSGIAIRVYRHVSQDVCSWNARFASELREPAFAAREVLVGRDALTLARGLPGMTQEEFSSAIKSSPVRRATLHRPKRNASVALGDVRIANEPYALTRARAPLRQ